MKFVWGHRDNAMVSMFVPPNSVLTFDPSVRSGGLLGSVWVMGRDLSRVNLCFSVAGGVSEFSHC